MKKRIRDNLASGATRVLVEREIVAPEFRKERFVFESTEVGDRQLEGNLSMKRNDQRVGRPQVDLEVAAIVRASAQSRKRRSDFPACPALAVCSLEALEVTATNARPL